VEDTEILIASVVDPELFAEFYRRHAEGILRFFVNRTFDPETAADLTAETFAEALASRHRFKATGSIPVGSTEKKLAVDWVALRFAALVGAAISSQANNPFLGVPVTGVAHSAPTGSLLYRGSCRVACSLWRRVHFAFCFSLCVH
jgi:hypothetical protein